ncbi:MAG: hypothetical protein E7317_06345 [Clostridiales bacterium]|nr:hypothetical protein [Clostridiales bacterium]
MKKKLLTDIELRAHWHRTHSPVYEIEPGTMLTPAARDFIRENRIELVEKGATMTRVSVPFVDGKPRFVDAATGERMDEKPEHMTHLNGNRLVSKLHPRILFRGKLDTLMAQILCLQADAMAEERPQLTEALDEVLDRTRQILSAEVREVPLEDRLLLGMTDEELRHASHDLKGSCGIDHPIPHRDMGRLALRLNLLRTFVRETELAAMAAFADDPSRMDIVRALNRLSSCVYLIFARLLSGKYEQRR